MLSDSDLTSAAAMTNERALQHLSELLRDESLLSTQLLGLTVSDALRASGYHVHKFPLSASANAARTAKVLLTTSDGCVYVAKRRRLGHDLFTVDKTGVTKEKFFRCRNLVDSVEDGTWLAVTPRHNLDSIVSEENKKSPWKRLAGLAAIERRDIWALVFYAIAIGVLSLLIPVGTQALVNTIAFGAILQPLLVLVLALGIGVGLSALLQVIQTYIVELLQRRLLVRVAEDIGSRYTRLAAQAKDTHDLVELNNRFFDVVSIQKSAAEILLSGLALVLQVVAGLILLGVYHPVLLGFSVVLLLGILLVIYLARGGTKTAIIESKAKFKVAEWLDTLAASPETFSGGIKRHVAEKELSRRTLAYVNARKNHFRRVYRVLVGGVTLQVLSIVMVLGIGGLLVINQQLNLGQLVASEIVIGAIAVGLGKMGRLADKAFDLVAATDKVGKILDLPLANDGRDELPACQGIEVIGQNVIAGYHNKPSVGPLNFSVKAGEKVQLCGAGGTILLDTLLGFRPPVAGKLTWNNRLAPTKDSLSDSIQRLAEPVVLPQTVFENIALVNPEISENEAWELLRLVGLSEAVDAAGGLQITLRQSGAPLSPSQVRRLMIARTLAANPQLLIIDRLLDHIYAGKAELEYLCRLLLGPDTPWTAIVITKDSVVESFLTRKINTEKKVEAS